MTNILLTLLFYILFFLVLLILLLFVFNFLVKMLIRRNKQLTRRLYLKEIPFTLNYHTIRRARIIGQFVGIFFLTAIIAFTVFNNFSPFGITLSYDMAQNTKNMSQLSPKSRVKIISYFGHSVSEITDNLVYFSTSVPFNFDSATVKVWFKNNAPNQTFNVGFQDQNVWHYSTIPYDVPFLNGLQWERSGTNPVLYQKQKNYGSTDEFLNNPPHNAIIGTYSYSDDIGNPNVNISDYKPSHQETVINTPLRGKQIIYAYLDNEPFNMTIEKQDLNWYSDPDTVKITVYKDNEMVFQTTMDDDGIIDSSHKIMPPTKVSIVNPGPGLPESGVYKIVIDANSDTIIKSIKTNLHKIVFANSIFPVGNSTSYQSIVSSTSASTLYTNALSLSAITYHKAGEQTIQVGNKKITLNTMQIPVTITPPDTLTKVVIPQNDVLLNGFQGYFAFSPDQFFMPSNYYVMPVTSTNDLKLIDYLLTNYIPTHKEDGWQVNEQTFDMRTAYINNGQLSWVIQSPQLKQNNGSLIIKDVQVIFQKSGWLKL